MHRGTGVFLVAFFFFFFTPSLARDLPDNNSNWNEHSFTGLFPGDVS